MDYLANILTESFMQRIGWTLVHSLWQGFAIAALLLLVLVFTKKARPSVRYMICCMTLLCMVVTPVVTFYSIEVEAKSIVPEVAVEAPLLAEPAEQLAAPVMIESLKPIVTQPQEAYTEPVVVERSVPIMERLSEFFEPILPYLVQVWMLGVFVLSIWHLGGWAHLQKLKRTMTKPVPENLYTRLTELAGLLGIKQSVALVESALVNVPTVIGWLKPVILLPASALTGLSLEQIEAILAHELAHIKRHDYLVNILQTVVEILGFYHPAMWLVSNKIRGERENCCDDIAVAVTGDRVKYAKALTQMEHLRGDRLSLAVAATGGNLFSRIKRLLRKDTSSNTSSWLPTAIIVLLLMSIAIPTVLAMSKKPKDEPIDALENAKTNEIIGDYKATLPNGMTVELLGVCEYPSEGKQWWGPDRNLLSLSLVSNVDLGGYNTKRDETVYELVVKLSGSDILLNRSITPEKWKISQARKVGLGLSGTAKDVNGIPCLRATSAIVKKGTEKVDIQFGLAGVWEKKLSISANESSKQTIQNTGIVINPPYEKYEPQGKSTNATVTIKVPNKIDSKMSIKIKAVLKNGKVAHAGWNRDGKISFMRSTDNYEFPGVRLSEVDHFELYTSKYEWAEFKDVALQPNSEDVSVDAAYIAQKVLDKYAEMETFSAVGQHVAKVERPNGEKGGILNKILGYFSKKLLLKSVVETKMARPNLYSIEWNENYNSLIMNEIGYAGSTGEGSYQLQFGKKEQFGSVNRGLITADYMTMQGYIFFEDVQLGHLKNLRDRLRREDQQVDGVDCYVISGKHLNMAYTYWVSKNDSLIHRFKAVGEGSDEKSEFVVTTIETYRNIIIDQPISREQFQPDKDVKVIRAKLKDLRRKYIDPFKSPSFESDKKWVYDFKDPDSLHFKSDPNAVAILDEVQETYDALETYSSSCHVDADYNSTLLFDAENFPDLSSKEIKMLEQNLDFKNIYNRSFVTNTSLTMKLARPKRYFMEWSRAYIKGRGSNYTGDQLGAVWSDGEDSYGIQYNKKKRYDHFCLGGGPWGSSETVPTIFYDRYNNTLKALKELVKEEDDVVEGQPCYVISGSQYDKPVRFWISKERLLILKKRSEINLEGKTSVLENNQTKKVLDAMSKQVTPEAIKLMEERIKNGFAKRENTRGVVTEIQSDIVVNEPIDIKPYISKYSDAEPEVQVDIEELLIQARKKVVEHDRGKAIELYRQAVKLAPENVKANLDLAWLLYMSKSGQEFKDKNGKTDIPPMDIKKIAPYFERVLELDPDNGSAMAGLGKIAEEKGDIEKAIEFYKKNIEVSGNAADASMRRLGRIYMRRGQYAEAVKYYEMLMIARPEEKAKAALDYCIEMLEKTKAEVQVADEYDAILYIWGYEDAPLYLLDGEIYRNVEDIVPHIGSLLKRNPRAKLKVWTRHGSRRWIQEPMEKLELLCQDAEFLINKHFEYDLKELPEAYKTDVLRENRGPLGVEKDSSSEVSARKIIKKVVVRYAGLESYSSEGEIVTDISYSGVDGDIAGLSDEGSKALQDKATQDALKTRHSFTHNFNIKLTRENYFIGWDQKVHAKFSNIGAVWSEGNEHFVFAANQKKPVENMQMALASAAGISGGAARTVPSLFFGESVNSLSELKEAKIEGEGVLDGIGCYILTGKQAGYTIKYWVDRNYHLIRRKQHIFDGNQDAPKMSEEDIMVMEASRGDQSDEEWERHKEGMRNALIMSSKMKGSTTETHRNIVLNKPIDITPHIAGLKNIEIAKSVIQTCEPQNNPNGEDMKVLTGQPGEQHQLSGRVFDEDGEPIKGVLVDVWHWHPGNETNTDENGFFELKGFDLDQKTVEIRFSKDGYSPRYIIKQPVGIKETKVILNSKTYFEGIVVDADGKPVANASIKALTGPKHAEGVMIGDVTTATTSDASGKYQLYVQADTYDVQVKADAGIVRLSGTKIQKDQALELDIKLEESVTFRARVIDSQTSEPVEGLRLWSWRNPGVEGTSNAEGIISIGSMLPGAFEFQVQGENAGRWWSEQCTKEWSRYQIVDKETGWQRNFDGLDFELTRGMEPVTIIVEKPVVVRGKIIDPDGKPVAGATATLARTGSGNSLTGDTRYSFATDEQGKFEMKIPASNKAEYNFIAHDGAFQQWRNWANGVLPPIKTQPGQVIEDVVIKLTRPATVKGTVYDDSGNPVADHKVRSHAFDKLGNRYYDPKTRTDADGDFEIKFIRPGKHCIQADPFWSPAEDGPDYGWKIITVEDGQTVELFSEKPKKSTLKEMERAEVKPLL